MAAHEAQLCDAILKLCARVEALEANSKSTPNPSQIRSSLDLTPKQQEEIAALLRPDPKPAVRRPLLVTRVAAAISQAGEPINWGGAYAAIREVAAWLDENTGGDAAWMLTQEAKQ